MKIANYCLMSAILTDSRTFKTLRLSLTNSCNLACTYCVDDNFSNKSKIITKNTLLDVDALVAIVHQLHAILQLQTIRLTGGEPTLYANIVPLIEKLAPLGVKIKLTTNGFLLENLLKKLPTQVFDSINVSLDAMSEDVFFKISKRKGLHKILDSIDTALAQNIHVKINTVVVRNANDSQILPLLEYAFSKNMAIRFLELMKMGHVFEGDFGSFFSQDDILKVIKSKYNFEKMQRTDAATANYWQTKQGHRFGIIANETDPFCGDCNRLRLDSFGNIYGCLSSNEPIFISDIASNSDVLAQKLTLAMAQKQTIKFVGSQLSMLAIGG